MITIYILECQENKYYVGKSKDPINRIINHFTGNGSEWTKKYKPIKIAELIECDDDYDEDKHTIKMMAKYGIDNVRGGTFCKHSLSLEEKVVIGLMIKGSTDKCYKCGNSGHFSKQCKVKRTDNYNLNKQEQSNSLISLLKLVHDLAESKNNKSKISNRKCYKCGRYGHYIKDCYASYHISGKKIENSKQKVYVKNIKINKSTSSDKIKSESDEK